MSEICEFRVHSTSFFCKLVLKKICVTPTFFCFRNLQNTDPLFEWGRFYTRYISEIESDPVGDYSRCREVFHELFGPDEHVTDEDCSATRYICELVSRR